MLERSNDDEKMIDLMFNWNPPKVNTRRPFEKKNTLPLAEFVWLTYTVRTTHLTSPRRCCSLIFRQVSWLSAWHYNCLPTKNAVTIIPETLITVAGPHRNHTGFPIISAIAEHLKNEYFMPYGSFIKIRSQRVPIIFSCLHEIHLYCFCKQYLFDYVLHSQPLRAQREDRTTGSGISELVHKSSLPASRRQHGVLRV